MYRDSLHTTPIKVSRSRRNHRVSTLTSAKSGKFVPVGMIPMLREDSLAGRLRIMVEMLETHQIIMNRVNLRVQAWAFPWMACERFEGDRGQFDRSWAGEPQVEGGDVVPFFENVAYGTFGSNAVYKALGLHAKSTDLVNTMPLEAYNAIWNHIAKLRSPKLTPRARLATDLAPAFWAGTRFDEIVPDFDQAVHDGKVALQVVESRLGVKGLAVTDSAGFYTGNAAGYRETGSGDVDPAGTNWLSPGSLASLRVQGDNTTGVPEIFAELQAGALQISLADIAMARKAQVFAKLREKYEDQAEYRIDMLMNGLSVPDMALSQPWLVADEMVNFTMAQRYATDSGNLDESAVSGAASAEIALRVPRVPTGAVVMVFVEAMPEQIYERQRDPFFFVDNTRDETTGELQKLPMYLRDALDPEKVQEVLNGDIDTSHTDAAGVFGYEPLNGRWNRFGPRIGGKFMRPTVDASTDVERLRLWAPENVDPALTEDFYLVNELHQKPFLNSTADPFEIMVDGAAVLDGLTQFGGRLVEATENYDKVLEKAPTERLVKEE